jgi:hypothetical protein
MWLPIILVEEHDRCMTSERWLVKFDALDNWALNVLRAPRGSERRIAFGVAAVEIALGFLLFAVAVGYPSLIYGYTLGLLAALASLLGAAVSVIVAVSSLRRTKTP